MGRAWPTAKRYEFTLDEGNEIREDPEIQQAYERLKALDVGWEFRQYYWTAGNETARVDTTELGQVSDDAARPPPTNPDYVETKAIEVTK